MRDFQPIEILLAEDNEDDVLILREIMEESKLVNLLQVVRDGEEALAYLRRQGVHANARLPGLVLLDINMPRMNGLEVLEELKADPALRHLPVVILTVSDRERDIVESYAHGACSYVCKPVDFDQFKRIVSQFEMYWSVVARVPRTDGTTSGSGNAPQR